MVNSSQLAIILSFPFITNCKESALGDQLLLRSGASIARPRLPLSLFAQMMPCFQMIMSSSKRIQKNPLKSEHHAWVRRTSALILSNVSIHWFRKKIFASLDIRDCNFAQEIT